MPLKTLVLLTVTALSGCAGVNVANYSHEQPELRLEEYFNGTLDAWGMFQKRDGTVVRRFKVVIEASWEGDRGILDELFTYTVERPALRRIRAWYQARHVQRNRLTN